MVGRVRRREPATIPSAEAPAAVCALCDRPLGQRVEWHHLVPRSQGGRDMVPLHPICHRTIHATFANAQLARRYATIGALRDQPPIARFLAWIAGKPADFTAPTHRSRAKR